MRLELSACTVLSSCQKSLKLLLVSMFVVSIRMPRETRRVACAFVSGYRDAKLPTGLDSRLQAHSLDTSALITMKSSR